jgi:hypothetical protein
VLNAAGRGRTPSLPPAHGPHGFSFQVSVARQAGQASQSFSFFALPMTLVQRLPTVTWPHWPLIISGEYDTAPQRVQTATGCGFCSGMESQRSHRIGQAAAINGVQRRHRFGHVELRAESVIPGEAMNA